MEYEPFAANPPNDQAVAMAKLALTAFIQSQGSMHCPLWEHVETLEAAGSEEVGALALKAFRVQYRYALDPDSYPDLTPLDKWHQVEVAVIDLLDFTDPSGAQLTHMRGRLAQALRGQIRAIAAARAAGEYADDTHVAEALEHYAGTLGKRLIGRLRREYFAAVPD